MKITKTEEVTREYCDVCGSSKMQTKYYTGGYVTCGRTLSLIREDSALKTVSITCNDMAEIWINNPSLAKWQTKESIEEMQNA